MKNDLPKTPEQILKPILGNLKELGFNGSAIKKHLPEWWDEAIIHPSGIQELKGFIAKHYGLKITSDWTLALPENLPEALFKHSINTNQEQVNKTRIQLAAVASKLATSTKNPWQGKFPSASELRKIILAKPNTPWVGLKELLNICWEYGVPVGYAPDLSVTNGKIDGMVTFCLGRPVIMICKASKFPAWSLFVLAHEIGHLALSHLKLEEGFTVIDNEISQNKEDNDLQEKEANKYAIDLLAAGERYCLSKYTNAYNLAKIAREKGRKEKIDPGHLILNIANTSDKEGKKLYGLASMAIKTFEKETTKDICKKILHQNIDSNLLPDDTISFLEKHNII